MMTTDCPDCADRELRQNHPAWWMVNRAIKLVMPARRESIFAGTARLMTAFLGGGAERTWYEKHRELWEETGDIDELERMKRHV